MDFPELMYTYHTISVHGWKNMLPGASDFQNPSLRRLGFLKIRAFGDSDFRKSESPEAWIFENPNFRSRYFLESIFRRQEIMKYARKTSEFMSPGTFHKESPKINVRISKYPSRRRLGFRNLELRSIASFRFLLDETPIRSAGCCLCLSCSQIVKLREIRKTTKMVELIDFKHFRMPELKCPKIVKI